MGNDLLYSLLVGGIAGWLATLLMKRRGFGLIINIVIGIFGFFLGKWLFSTLGINFLSGIIGDILKGAIGSVVILYVASLIKKR